MNRKSIVFADLLGRGDISFFSEDKPAFIESDPENWYKALAVVIDVAKKLRAAIEIKYPDVYFNNLKK